ncbi:MAG: hypothetical protein KAI95_14380 [Bacteroidales bacterium]|nr:hypothetical protein [Bacteroidales bacterium]
MIILVCTAIAAAVNWTALHPGTGKLIELVNPAYKKREQAGWIPTCLFFKKKLA